MAMQFEVKAYRPQDGVSTLTFTAADAADAERQAIAKGYKIISLHRSRNFLEQIKRRSQFSVPLFSQELLALLEAGLSLVETIDILAHKAKDGETRNVLATLGKCLREGLALSRALETMPTVFATMYVATVRTSEQTGDVAQALRRYLSYHQQINLVRYKVISASIYPALLMGAGLLVVMFLLGYVVPRFGRVYEDVGRNLPWMSMLLMQWGKFVGNYGGTLALGVFAFVGALAFVMSRPKVRSAIEKFIWSLPAIGEKILLYHLARFTRTLAMLLSGGIPFVSALDMSRGLLSQTALRDGMQLAAGAIREGRTVSSAFAEHGLATDVGVRLIVAGERSGNLGETMEKIATLYDGEISRWIDWFTRLFEPLLMIFIGLIIGLIVLLMYMPIFELANSIQ